MSTADTQHEDQVDKKLSFTASPNLPRDIHGAPPESFVARLAEIMAEIKTEQGLGEFWLEVIKEVLPPTTFWSNVVCYKYV